MANLFIGPSRLSGEILIPSSKSHTLRAILFASLAKGVSTIEEALPSPDTESMIHAIELLGAKVIREGKTLNISGVSGSFKKADDVIQCGNSGQVLRFVGAVAALNPSYTILTGDASIRHNRPIGPLLDGLQQLGATALSSRQDGYAPMIVKGPFTKNVATINGEDSQPVSGLLMAAAFAPFPIDLHVVNPGEKPWVALTLDWFSRLGIAYTASNFAHYRMEGS
jgi:3-phosphoshikimate 1-carboxyvinyltransferase